MKIDYGLEVILSRHNNFSETSSEQEEHKW